MGKKKKNKKKMRLGGLFKTIFISSMLCMLIPLLITEIYTVINVHSNMETVGKTNLTALSQEKMNQVDAIISNQIQLTQSVADSPYISKIVADQFHGEIDPAANRTLNNYLASINEDSNSLYENFFITCGTTTYLIVWI